jgi:Flp pilus assembly protein TadG
MSRRLPYRQERGQELVEYALLLPVLLLLTVGIMEFSIISFAYNTIANAAREGARMAIIPTNTDADVMAAVLDRALALNLEPGDVTITRLGAVGSLNATVQIVVDHDVTLMTGPMIDAAGGNPTLPLRAAATMISE